MASLARGAPRALAATSVRQAAAPGAQCGVRGPAWPRRGRAQAMAQGTTTTLARVARAAGLAASAAAAVMAMEARGVGQTSGSKTPAAKPADVRFMTLDPGHFHAALVQKEMYPGVSPQV